MCSRFSQNRNHSPSVHIEVQILADEYGNAIALFGCDNEGTRRQVPVTVANPELFKQMEMV